MPGWDGVEQRLLARDPDNGSVTARVDVRAGAAVETASSEGWRETFVLAGALLLDGRSFAAGAYLCRPPGEGEQAVAAEEGAVVLQLREVNGALDKPAVALTAEEVDALPWTQKPDGTPGQAFEKILTRGPSGSFARVLRLDGVTPGVALHTYDEDCLVLAGACRVGDETHVAGTYTFNPAGTPHGPFAFIEPLRCVEFANHPPEATTAADSET
nr:cupin domain-containing protein [Conexibacter arvalis]